MTRPAVNPSGPALALVVATCALAVSGCGSDSMGPDGDVDFALLPPQQAATWCVQGAVAVPDDVSGTISVADDCLTNVTQGILSVEVGSGPDTYFETWRVRVGSSRSVTFTVLSGFDSFLDLYRVPDINDLSTAVFLAFDDDGGTNFNARLSFTLSPNTEYWIMVSGFDASDTGPYTLTMN